MQTQPLGAVDLSPPRERSRPRRRMTTGRATKATSIARPGRSPPASTATASRIDGPKFNGPLRQRRAHDEPDRKLDARGHPRGGVQPLAHAGVGEPAGGEEVEQE